MGSSLSVGDELHVGLGGMNVEGNSTFGFNLDVAGAMTAASFSTSGGQGSLQTDTLIVTRTATVGETLSVATPTPNPYPHPHPNPNPCPDPNPNPNPNPTLTLSRWRAT